MKRKIIVNPIEVETVIKWTDMERGYTYSVRQIDGDEIRIEAGCQEWDTFKEAFAHYADRDHDLNKTGIDKSDMERNSILRQRIETSLRAMQRAAKKIGWPAK